VDLPVHQKMSFWNDVSSRTFAPMEIVPGHREHFDGKLSRQVLGPLALADVCSAAGVIHHTRSHIARADDRGYTLVAPIRAGFNISLGHEASVALRTGEFCLLDQTRPYRLTLDQFAQTFCVGLEGRYLRDFLPDPQRVVGKVMRPVHSASRLLVLLFENLSKELQQNCMSPMTPAFAHSLTSFIAAAYSEVIDVAESSVLQSRKRCIRRFVDEHLHDPELRPAAIARQFAISGRYLRLMFESENEPLSAYILRRRLEQCARLLRDPSWRGQSITEIALRNGFNNPTHFGSAFKKRFGMTPREYRCTGASLVGT
jgi:AraC family transcriptional activator of tynA and feaB